jgi:hypothetical protein
MDPNRKGVVIGGVVTAISTGLIFLLPVLVPVREFKLAVYQLTGEWMFGNPLAQFRLLGGIPGGFVGGYFARDHFGSVKRGNSMTVGVYATGTGLLAVLLFVVLFNVYSATVTRGIVPPPIYLIVVVPLIATVPLFPAYLVEGLVFGYLAGALQTVRAG